jgi:hypothetical protein
MRTMTKIRPVTLRAFRTIHGHHDFGVPSVRDSWEWPNDNTGHNWEYKAQDTAIDIPQGHMKHYWCAAKDSTWVWSRYYGWLVSRVGRCGSPLSADHRSWLAGAFRALAQPQPSGVPAGLLGILESPPSPQGDPVPRSWFIQSVQSVQVFTRGPGLPLAMAGLEAEISSPGSLVLDTIPKRVGTQLVGNNETRPFGWALLIEEGFDVSTWCFPSASAFLFVLLQGYEVRWNCGRSSDVRVGRINRFNCD